MFTTEEKVNLLKKCQAKWLKNDSHLEDEDWEALAVMGIEHSFIEMNPSRFPETITQKDLIARER